MSFFFELCHFSFLKINPLLAKLNFEATVDVLILVNSNWQTNLNISVHEK